MLLTCLLPIFKKCNAFTPTHTLHGLLTYQQGAKANTREYTPEHLRHPSSNGYYSNILGVRTICCYRLPRLMIIAYMIKAKILLHTSIYIDTSNIYEY